ncbi:MAG: 5-bromo-4-chloroindolyl phosphate hydrolysis family protein [Mangrovicoccus sp.]
MAQKFGGAYSPGAQSTDSQPAPKSAFRGKSPAKAGARVNLLFVMPFIFLISAFFSETLGLALNLAAFALMMLAAYLTQQGLIAEAAFNARQVAKRPAIPRKIFGAAAMGLGLGIAASWRTGLDNGVILGAVGAVLHLLAFGLDPLRDKLSRTADDFQTGRVMRAVEEAETILTEMSQAIATAKDRALENRVASFKATARDMFRQIEQDPRDLVSARKYLGIYLIGARDATTKFATLYARNRDPQARANYEALLADLETNFATKTETLLIDDRAALDVEINVLRERLEREAAAFPERT